MVCGRETAWSGRGRRPSTCGQRCRKRKQRGALPAVIVNNARWTARDGKRPIMVDGSPASSTNPDTWTDYRAVAQRPHGVMLGDGLACWDLDDVLDGDVLAPAAVELLDSVEPLWVERSMSGRGLHVFVRGGGPSKQTRHISYYSHSRFIAVTGDAFRR
ncbi:hypothetical protein GCM10023217_30040 [Gordonia alkaliphila]|uniref:DNA primase/polymerase bifunctional N-terminal domain-containing protein n=2 Tax=Gordonia alkaliphila TaxID=1053547 RepID=A0ABP8ZGC4_9ACTN